MLNSQRGKIEIERKGVKQSGFEEVAVPGNDEQIIKDKNLHTSHSEIVSYSGFSDKKIKGELPNIADI